MFKGFWSGLTGNKYAKALPEDLLETPMREGEVLIRVTEEFLRKLMTRTEDGEKMMVVMGQPRSDGTYEPQITVAQDGKVVVDKSVLVEWRVMKDALLEQKKKRVSPGLVAVRGGRIVDADKEPIQ